MSDAFEKLSAALKEAIADVEAQNLSRRYVEIREPRTLKRLKVTLKRTRPAVKTLELKTA